MLLVSQLSPYKGWDDLFNRFVDVWQFKSRLIGHKSVSRIGIRYINRIDVPFSSSESIVDEDTYLNIFPKVPKSFGTMGAYAIQVQNPINEFTLRVNSAVVASPVIGCLGLLLDLDISKEHDIPQNDDGIFNFLKNLQSLKNSVFEDCITDKTRALFENAN